MKGFPEDFYQGPVEGEENGKKNRHLIFATPTQRLLASSSRRWFVDGTYKLIGLPFTQLWVIHCTIKGKDGCKKTVISY